MTPGALRRASERVFQPVLELPSEAAESLKLTVLEHFPTVFHSMKNTRHFYRNYFGKSHHFSQKNLDLKHFDAYIHVYRVTTSPIYPTPLRANQQRFCQGWTIKAPFMMRASNGNWTLKMILPTDGCSVTNHNIQSSDSSYSWHSELTVVLKQVRSGGDAQPPAPCASW